MKRALSLVALLLAACAVAWPTPQLAVYPAAQGARVVLTVDAAAQVERLADKTRRTRREQAACVVDYAVLPVARDSVVIGILALGAAAPYVSDSLYVRTRDGQEFCASGTPNVHTHIVPNETWGKPSAYDVLQAQQWPTVPFRVLVSVRAQRPSLVTVYGVRP